MALNIFRDTKADAEAARKSQFANDIVGTFRAGRLDAAGNPQSLDKWRVTTGDPAVADEIADLFEGTEPEQWDTKGEEGLEVYTDVHTVTILLDSPKAVRQRFVQRNRNGEMVYTSDGAVKDDGTADPHAQLTLDERLKLASDGLGPQLETTIWFKLEKSPDLGRFKFQSSGKSIGKAVDRDQIEQELADYIADGGEGTQVRATLKIEKVSFTAKNGPRAGKLVEYNTAAIKLLGPAKK